MYFCSPKLGQDISDFDDMLVNQGMFEHWEVEISLKIREI